MKKPELTDTAWLGPKEEMDRASHRFGKCSGWPRSRKIDLPKVRASLNATCPKCGFTITPDLLKRVDFERMECPKCGERFEANAE
jgi:ribosomal protein L37AE/L43A